MIIGIGTDLIEVARVAAAYEKPAFRNRVYTRAEQELIGERMQRAASHFAVKEAVAKAFGTGFRAMAPSEIEVLREPSGKPYVVLHGNAKQEMERQQAVRIHVSMSDVKEQALAYVILEG